MNNVLSILLLGKVIAKIIYSKIWCYLLTYSFLYPAEKAIMFTKLVLIYILFITSFTFIFAAVSPFPLPF